jgi:hypothetical protein
VCSAWRNPVWIMGLMSEPVRKRKMTVSLSDDEFDIRDELALALGVDANGAMRQGMLRLARKLGITHQTIREKRQKKNAPKH